MSRKKSTPSSFNSGKLSMADIFANYCLSAHAQLKSISQSESVFHYMQPEQKQGQITFRGRPESVFGDQNARAIKNKNVICRISVSGESLFGPNRRKCSPG
jgi:hypothetical protein